jgi:uncharacterized protein
MQPPTPLRANRLSRETSPYLLQHAHNPVDWYPWGREAFAAAKAQDKPIFLSVGYSTCYWCHVMERQSFENDQIAAEMNARFINIKVDREERPDVDQLYMNAIHALSGQGGWPMSVFLTPDLKPFYGGTYFPPTDGHGRIGFPRLLIAIDDAWKQRRKELEQSADELVSVLQKMAEPPPSRAPVVIDALFLNNLLDRSTSDYDPTDGGFGSAPKFPRQTLLEFILTAQHHFPSDTRMAQLLHTLNAMAAGGIRDHLGGAFHRYSTDNQWLVPHFEIMLYDNAMLAWVYAEAFAQTGDNRHADVARGILDFILREMTDQRGGFYTAFDAEVDAQEGLSYLWTADEIEAALGPDAELFNRVYGVSAGPNFADPHNGRGAPDKNILFLPEPIDAATDRKLAPLRQTLYALRRKRKQPLLDTKILTSWNSLMIRAMSHAAKVLGEDRYLTAANRAADFLLSHHRTPDGGLHRTTGKGDGYLDDYAYLTQALMALGRRDEAVEIWNQLCDRFLDSGKGGFYFTAEGDPEMIVRQKTASDSPLPSGNAVAAMVALQLNHPQIAHDTITVFAGQLERFGEGMSALAQAAMLLGSTSVAGGASTAPPKEIMTLSADWSAPDVLQVRISIAEGFHINGPDATGGLTPTRLSISGHAAEFDYSPTARKTFPFADEPIDIYEGQITITVRFNKTPPRPITLTLHCQPCNETSCLAAMTTKLEIK